MKALLIEKRAGKPYAKYVQEGVLRPIGMKDTAWRQPGSNWSRFAAMYLRKAGALVRQDDDTTRVLRCSGSIRRTTIAAMYFVQTMPFDVSLHRDIRAAVYGSGYLGPAGNSPPD